MKLAPSLPRGKLRPIGASVHEQCVRDRALTCPQIRPCLRLPARARVKSSTRHPSPHKSSGRKSNRRGVRTRGRCSSRRCRPQSRRRSASSRNFDLAWIRSNFSHRRWVGSTTKSASAVRRMGGPSGGDPCARERVAPQIFLREKSALKSAAWGQRVGAGALNAHFGPLKAETGGSAIKSTVWLAPVRLRFASGPPGGPRGQGAHCGLGGRCNGTHAASRSYVLCVTLPSLKGWSPRPCETSNGICFWKRSLIPRGGGAPAYPSSAARRNRTEDLEGSGPKESIGRPDRSHLDNSIEPLEPALSEAEKADTNAFLREMLNILPLIGLNAFEKPKAVAQPMAHSPERTPITPIATVEADEPNLDDRFHETCIMEPMG